MELPDPVELPDGVELPDPNAALTAIATRRPLLVVCDFDGTLSPIVADPGMAALAEGVERVLLALLEFPGVHVAVMSGRGHDDLADRVGRSLGVHLIGSHGAEYGRPADQSLTGLRDDLVGELRELLAPYDGAFLEIKPVSASVHTRRMPDRQAAATLRDLTVAGPGATTQRTVKAGKEVVEISVIEADKGVALRRLADQVAAAAIVYFGDDVTDEDAFAVLGHGDMGIKVGQGPTRAGYRLPDSSGVVVSLHHLVDALADGDADLRMAHWIDPPRS